VKIAIITDIHEDVISLKKAFKMIEREKCDYVICLGDILGYPFNRAKYASTRNASECIHLIKKYCRIVLLGNHDIFHLKKIPQHNSGFVFPSNWYNLSAFEKTETANGRVWNYTDDYSTSLSENEIEYMGSLPECYIKEVNMMKVLFSHFIYPNFTGYVSIKNGDMRDLGDHFTYMKENSCEISICGHMHIEGIGIGYESGNGVLSGLFPGYNYFSYGERKLKNRLCSISIPALADNSQVNGFAIFNSTYNTINALSLNINCRIIL